MFKEKSVASLDRQIAELRESEIYKKLLIGRSGLSDDQRFKAINMQIEHLESQKKKLLPTTTTVAVDKKHISKSILKPILRAPVDPEPVTGVSKSTANRTITTPIPEPVVRQQQEVVLQLNRTVIKPKPVKKLGAHAPGIKLKPEPVQTEPIDRFQSDHFQSMDRNRSDRFGSDKKERPDDDPGLDLDGSESLDDFIETDD